MPAPPWLQLTLNERTRVLANNTYFIDGKRIDQQDRFGDGSRWFEMMLLPDQSEVTGPFTPVEFARHRAWALDPAWAIRHAIHVPMQDANDTYNGGFWPQKQCEPADVIACGLQFGRQYRACVFKY